MAANPTVSPTYAQKKYLGWSDVDVKANREFLRKDKELEWELNQIVNGGPNWREAMVSGGPPGGAEEGAPPAPAGGGGMPPSFGGPAAEGGPVPVEGEAPGAAPAPAGATPQPPPPPAPQ